MPRKVIYCAHPENCVRWDPTINVDLCGVCSARRHPPSIDWPRVVIGYIEEEV